jgi:hypothetical protein
LKIVFDKRWDNGKLMEVATAQRRQKKKRKSLTAGAA